MSTDHSHAVGQGNRQGESHENNTVVSKLASVETQLWLFLICVLLADVLLTQYGLQVGLTEGNPAMRIAIDTFGIAALLGVKVLVVGFGAGVRHLMDDRGAVVPLGLALPWFAAASVNATLLL